MKKFLLKEYIEKLYKENLILEDNTDDKMKDEVVNLLSYNSKEVEKNTLFVCKGATFKKEYLADAISSGVMAYVSETKFDVEVPCILVKNSYIALASLSEMYFDFPTDKLNVIGITGTKGKSTTAYYIKYILDEYMKSKNKKETAIISSIDTIDGVIKEESHITTPESYELERHFRNAVNSDMENVVMEVSSQALKMGRVHSVNFDVGVFLNISEDHISPIEHKDFNDYFESKLKIFKHSKLACINLDSDHVDRVIEASSDSPKVITFSKTNSTADIYAYNIKKVEDSIIFMVKTPEYEKEFELTMPGLFNVENALAAISVCYALNIPVQFIYDGLRIARSSGRMELYSTKDKNILALVDYAHNKLSFEKLFESTKAEYPDRKILIVFGCPGKKALLRRKDLGTIAGKYADKVYLTAEDPGAEPVIDICNDIASYVSKYTSNYEIIEDREEAIKKAILTAPDNSIILLTGKGNETRQKYGTEYIPCLSDVECVKKYFDEYDKNGKGE